MSLFSLMRELASVVLLALIAMAAGVAFNQFRAQPLPMRYQPPEQRFDAQLRELIANPGPNGGELQTVGLDEFREIATEHKALILDARASSIYELGHVPTALNLSRVEFASDFRRLSPVLKSAHDKPIVVYCSGGDCHDSKMVASALLSLGFERVRVFTAGWEGWSGAGLPSEHSGDHASR